MAPLLLGVVAVRALHSRERRPLPPRMPLRTRRRHVQLQRAGMALLAASALPQ
jgi:hypothetical protein